MHVLLLYNPNATGTDERLRDVIASAIGSVASAVDVVATKQRGQAVHLAAEAVHTGVEVVVVLGGDGTANEAVQALAGTEVALGLLPGGSTNVLARALGLPADPIGATATLVEYLRTGKRRRIGLGRAAGRYFAFNAGFGFDAAVVRAVERRPRLKRALPQWGFVVSAVWEWATGPDRRAPSVTVEVDPGRPTGPYPVVILGNMDPYTYLGRRPMRVTPEARPDAGIDLLAVRPVGTLRLLRIAVGTFAGGRHLRDPAVEYHHDLRQVTLRSPVPRPLMVDGDYAGEYTEVPVVSVPDALTVIA